MIHKSRFEVPLLACWLAMFSLPSSGHALDWAPCWLTAGEATVQAQCTQLDVPIDYADETMGNIRLNMAKIAAKGKPLADPVFLIAGGPGQSIAETYPLIRQSFGEINKMRDIYLLDQRGTGGSQPFQCDMEQEQLLLDAAEVVQHIQTCFEQAPLPPQFLSTHYALEDLDLARWEVGADKVNLIGVSYGTRVAQAYAQRYPQNTRTIVLDAVVPLSDEPFFLPFDDYFNQALVRLDARCQQDVDCAALGNMVANFQQIQTQLAATPFPVEVMVDGYMQTINLDPEGLRMVVGSLIYSRELQSLLPFVMSEAVQGRYQPLLKLGQKMQSSMGDSIATGMHYAVVCTEDAPKLAEPTVNESFVVIQYRQVCDALSLPVAPDLFLPHSPILIPSLLLSGELDPVTPPESAEKAMEYLPSGKHLVAKGHGHGLLSYGCIPTVVANFINAGNSDELDTDCVTRMDGLPLFISSWGTAP